jgi:hypothetical protein
MDSSVIILENPLAKFLILLTFVLPQFDKVPAGD